MEYISVYLNAWLFFSLPFFLSVTGIPSNILSYYCFGGKAIFERHICDGKSQCYDDSDEKYCISTSSFKGHIYTAKNPANGWWNLQIVDSSKCLGPSIEEFCVNSYYLTTFKPCTYCVVETSPPSIIGNGHVEMLYGIDETETASQIQDLGDPTVLQSAMFYGLWRCANHSNDNMLALCHQSITRHTIFLHSFPSARGSSSFQCPLGYRSCQNNCVHPDWACSFQTEPAHRKCREGSGEYNGNSGKCELLQCPRSKWLCDHRCIVMTSLCRESCAPNYNRHTSIRYQNSEFCVPDVMQATLPPVPNPLRPAATSDWPAQLTSGMTTSTTRSNTITINHQTVAKAATTVTAASFSSSTILVTRTTSSSTATVVIVKGDVASSVSYVENSPPPQGEDDDTAVAAAAPQSSNTQVTSESNAGKQGDLLSADPLIMTYVYFATGGFGMVLFAAIGIGILVCYCAKQRKDREPFPLADGTEHEISSSSPDYLVEHSQTNVYYGTEATQAGNQSQYDVEMTAHNIYYGKIEKT